MSSKKRSPRSSDEDKDKDAKVLKQIPVLKSHSYGGYRIESPGQKLDRVYIDEISVREFEEAYILAHKPCIIRGAIPGLQLEDFKVDSIEKTLSFDQELQVERKIDGGFGSGHERLRMTFHDFFTKLKNGEESLYLTTQYNDEENDEEEEEDDDEDDDEDEDEENEKGFLEDGDFPDSDSDSIDMNNLQDDFVDSEQEDDEQEGEVAEAILQPPLTNLLDQLPLKPTLFENSNTQQINLWMGSSGADGKDGKGQVKLDSNKPYFGVGRFLPNSKGTSSGLHHDHSDNLYIPIKGRKRFTLFSPYDADSLYTVGDIRKLYSNGVIDYEINDNAPNWNHVNSQGVIIEREEEEEEEGNKAKKIAKEVGTKLDPPSFSKIPPFYIHLEDIKDDDSTRDMLQNDLVAKFPSYHYNHVNKIQVELERGEMLFLPCGWFHEVTSYGNEDGIHIALNYWFEPLVLS